MKKQHFLVAVSENLSLYLRWSYSIKGHNENLFYLMIIQFPFVSSFRNVLNDPSVTYGCRVMSKSVSKLRENQGVETKWSKMAKMVKNGMQSSKINIFDFYKITI